jgi:hypothetical protein
MRRHWEYFRYLGRHKYFVFLAGLQTGAPLWRLVIHDWSKFLPSEWLPYSKKFYGPGKISWITRRIAQLWNPNIGVYRPEATTLAHEGWERYAAKRDYDFNVAWLKHQHRSPHHWQHWLLAEDNPSKRLETPQTSGAQRAFPLQMPEHFVREMVADWAGAGRAIAGKWELPTWFRKNRANIVLDDATKMLVIQLIQKLTVSGFLESDFCKATLQMPEQPSITLHCVRYPEHTGDHHDAQTGFAWAPEAAHG